MFLGTHHNKLDEKGRITLPAAFRRAVQNADKGCYIAVSSKKPCLIGVMIGKSSPDMITVDTAPLFQAVSLDTTGRFVLGQAFRTALTSKTQTPDSVVVVGRKNYFEIWTEENWQNEEARLYEKRGPGITPDGQH